MTTADTTTDPFSMLEEDHREVERLLHELAASPVGADADRTAILERLQEALSIHMDFEESEIYPLVARTIAVPEADARHHEHDEVRALLGRLGTSSGDEQFPALVAEIDGAIARHVGIEESEIFPRLRDVVGQGEQEHLVASLTAMREAAR